MVMLKRGTNFGEEIMRLTFNDFSKVSVDTVRQKGFTHKAEVVKALDDNARMNKVNALSDITKFTKEELADLYNWTQQTTDSFLFSPEQFYGVIAQFCSFWLDLVQTEMAKDVDRVGELQKNLWQWFTKEDEKEKLNTNSTRSKLLTFDGLCYGLSLILKGNVKQRWTVCTDLVCPSSNEMSFNEVVRAVQLLLMIDGTPGTVAPGFVQMLWEKEVQSKDHKITKETLQAEIIDKPLLSEFFDLESNANTPW